MPNTEEEKKLQQEQADQAQAGQTTAQKLQTTRPSAYQSKWQGQIQDTMGKIQNRQPFSFDLNQDALYEQLKNDYVAGGRMAMMDTMGQTQAMTGGYGNSYAQNAGQQAYQAYLQGLTDVVPDVYQMALDRYMAEGDALEAQYGMLMDQDAMDYGRFADDTGWEQWLQEFQEDQRRYDQEWAEAHPETAEGGGPRYLDPGLQKPTYEEVRQAYIGGSQTGASDEAKQEYLDEAVQNGYITEAQAKKIAGIYYKPTTAYTAQDHMWDRHS